MERKISSDEIDAVRKVRWSDDIDDLSIKNASLTPRQDHRRLGRKHSLRTGALFCVLGLFLWLVHGASFKRPYVQAPPSHASSSNPTFNKGSSFQFMDDWDWNDVSIRISSSTFITSSSHSSQNHSTSQRRNRTGQTVFTSLIYSISALDSA